MFAGFTNVVQQANYELSSLTEAWPPSPFDPIQSPASLDSTTLTVPGILPAFPPTGIERALARMNESQMGEYEVKARHFFQNTLPNTTTTRIYIRQDLDPVNDGEWYKIGELTCGAFEEVVDTAADSLTVVPRFDPLEGKAYLTGGVLTYKFVDGGFVSLGSKVFKCYIEP